jgi:hypothetical protein
MHEQVTVMQPFGGVHLRGNAFEVIHGYSSGIGLSILMSFVAFGLKFKALPLAPA